MRHLPNELSHSELTRVFNRVWDAIGGLSKASSSGAPVVAQTADVTSGKDGSPGAAGANGSDGADGATGPAGPGLPPGGLTGQIPAKIDGTDYNIQWINPPSGGGASETWTFYDADLEPASPSAIDDEFNGSSTLDAKWSKVNWVSSSPLHTYDVNSTIPMKLYSSLAAGGGSTFRAILQAVPAGDFTIVTKVFCSHPGSYPAAGLILSTTNTAGTGSQFVWQNFLSYGFMTRSVTNFNTDGGYTNAGPTLDNYYIRIRRSGSTYYFGWSYEGITWTEVTAAPGFTPSYFGIHVYANSTSVNMVTTFEYFRYYSSATPTMGGVRHVQFTR